MIYSFDGDWANDEYWSENFKLWVAKINLFSEGIILNPAPAKTPTIISNSETFLPWYRIIRLKITKKNTTNISIINLGISENIFCLVSLFINWSIFCIKI